MGAERNNQHVSTEQKVNEMVQQSRVLETYMNDVITREDTVARLMEEARLASSALQNIIESEVESLFPIGIGVYVKGLIPRIDRLLVNVGGGVTIEKSREDALNYIESRIKEFEMALRQLGSQKQQIASRMGQLQSHINDLLRQTDQKVPSQHPQRSSND